MAAAPPPPAQRQIGPTHLTHRIGPTPEHANRINFDVRDNSHKTNQLPNWARPSGALTILRQSPSLKGHVLEASVTRHAPLPYPQVARNCLSSPA